MTGVHRMIATVAPTESTVLILGETGTGKELAARALWQQSKRNDMPFVPVNCGALSENLVESELFGHRKGAFTGADRDHKGLFEVANGGTLFLDELGELNKNIQVKLLRFLESGEIRRVGDTEPFRVDVRVLCATNRDLRQMIQEDDVPRGPVLPHQHVRDPPAAAARAAFRHPRPGPAPAGAGGPPAGGAGGGAAEPGGDRRAAGTRMAGQRPRAGQRDGARLHHRRRRPHHAGAFAAHDPQPRPDDAADEAVGVRRGCADGRPRRRGR